MAELKITVLVEQDGLPLPGFPLIQRQIAEQVALFAPAVHPGAPPGTFSALPTPQIALLQALIVRPDHLVTVRLDGQSDAGLDVDPGGLLIVLGGSADAGPSLNVTLHAAATTLIRGLAAGAAA